MDAREALQVLRAAVIASIGALRVPPDPRNRTPSRTVWATPAPSPESVGLCECHW